jgi:hypothetical protein
MSGLNEDAISHTLAWCMEAMKQIDPAELKMTLPKYRYRLRNVVTGDILMGAIL